MLKEIRPALTLLLVMTVITGLAYPAAMTGLAGLLFPHQAAGSLIEKDGKTIGSELIGQNFTKPIYFQSRPSATTAPDPNDATKTVAMPYNAQNSGATNLAPSAKAYADAVAANAEAVRAANPQATGPVPSDLVTASASGLDPDESPEAILYQAKRVAAARHAPVAEIRKLIADFTQQPALGVLGDAHVNVLKLNLALDERWPVK